MATNSTSVESRSHEPILDDYDSGAALLGITVWQLRGLVANGEIPVIKIGRKFHFRRSSLLRWAERAERKV